MKWPVQVIAVLSVLALAHPGSSQTSPENWVTPTTPANWVSPTTLHVVLVKHP